MKFLYVFIFCLLTSSIHAQIFSSCQTDSILLENYEQTVKGLALERIYEFNHIDSQNIDIPQVWQDSIMEAIGAVYNIGTSERDSVFAIYCINDYHYTNSRNGLFAYPDTSISWVYNWIFNDSMIVDTDFKTFVLEHNLELDKTYILNSSVPAIKFYANELINFNRIVDTFMTFSFLNSIEATSFFYGDGDNIRYSTIGNNRYLDFELGWEDCPLGCISHRIWRFEVLPDCSVNFINSFGSSTNPNPMLGNPPYEKKCYWYPTNTKNKTKPLLTNVHIYPNPTNNYFQIEIETNLTNEYQLEIYNIVGKQKILKKIQHLDKIDITQLSNGLYIVIIKNKDGQIIWNGKVFKQ